MEDVTQRILRLLAILQGGRAFSGAELAARLEVSPRTLRRDVERLRDYGYLVSTRPGPGGSYHIAAGHRLPPLILDDDEAIATVVGLAILGATTSARAGVLEEVAGRAYTKIDALLPARLRPRAAALRASIEAEPRPSTEVAAKTLGELGETITAQEIITFDYVDAHGVSSDRRVEPHRQIHIDQQWYLFGWDLHRHDWRIFRTDRIMGMCRTARRYAPRLLPDDSVVAYLRSGASD